MLLVHFAAVLGSRSGLSLSASTLRLERQTAAKNPS